MRGVYIAQATVAANTAGTKDLLSIVAPSTAAVEILSIKVTDRDNDTNEQFVIEIQRAGGTPAGGTGLTIIKTESGSAAASSTAMSSPTSGITSPAAIEEFAGPLLGGIRETFIPEGRPTLAPSEVFVVNQSAAISTATNLQVVVKFREIG
jgi:hypothetical protein